MSRSVASVGLLRTSRKICWAGWMSRGTAGDPKHGTGFSLAREFGRKLCFNGGVDVQGTLIHGSPADVKREVENLVRLFGRYDGGYIGGTSHSVMPETPLDNVIALYEAFLQYR